MPFGKGSDLSPWDLSRQNGARALRGRGLMGVLRKGIVRERNVLPERSSGLGQDFLESPPFYWLQMEYRAWEGPIAASLG